MPKKFYEIDHSTEFWTPSDGNHAFLLHLIWSKTDQLKVENSAQTTIRFTLLLYRNSLVQERKLDHWYFHFADSLAKTGTLITNLNHLVNGIKHIAAISKFYFTVWRNSVSWNSIKAVIIIEELLITAVLFNNTMEGTQTPW